jgi:hypothetical protein
MAHLSIDNNMVWCAHNRSHLIVIINMGGLESLEVNVEVGGLGGLFHPY